MNMVMMPRTSLFQQFEMNRPAQSAMRTSQPSDLTDRFERALTQGLQDARMHWLNTLLMGIGTVLLPVIPRFRHHMSFRKTVEMAPVHMALMLGISFMLGFMKGFNNNQAMTGMQHL